MASSSASVVGLRSAALVRGVARDVVAQRSRDRAPASRARRPLRCRQLSSAAASIAEIASSSTPSSTSRARSSGSGSRSRSQLLVLVRSVVLDVAVVVRHQSRRHRLDQRRAARRRARVPPPLRPRRRRREDRCRRRRLRESRTRRPGRRGSPAGSSRGSGSSPTSRCSRRRTRPGGRVRPRSSALRASTPWFIAPSPIETMQTRPVPVSFAAIATPAPIGIPAPTIEFSPMKPRSGAIRYGEPARPPLTPPARWQISAISSAQRDAPFDRPAVAAVGRDDAVVGLERRARADGDRLLPAAEMHRAGDRLAAQVDAALLEQADREHPPVHVGQLRRRLARDHVASSSVAR